MTFSIKTLTQNEQGARIRFTRNGSELTVEEVLNYWKSSSEATEKYLHGIKHLGIDQFYWEHPAFNLDNMNLPYECMLLKTDHFNRREIDPAPFAKYLNSENPVAVFDNLGRNARLVVPTIKSPIENYKHLGIFLNSAPHDQIMETFKAIGKSVLEELKKNREIWLSTAGLGVIWLHIRLDTVPKYYKIKTYKDPTFLIRAHTLN